jgi:uncharacterized protein (DUF427 family)
MPDQTGLAANGLLAGLDEGEWISTAGPPRTRRAVLSASSDPGFISNTPGVLTMQRPVLQPGPNHPISIEPLGRRVTVVVAGQTIAESDKALRSARSRVSAGDLYPASGRPDGPAGAERSQFLCPYKGDASYFSIPAGGSRSVDAVWTYEAPYEAVSEIKDHLAFYPDRVDAIT